MKNITITLFLFLCLSTIAQTDDNLNAYLNNLFLDLSSLTTKSEILHAIQSDNNFKDVEIGIGEDGGIIGTSIAFHPQFKSVEEDHVLLIFFDKKENITKMLLVLRGNYFNEIVDAFNQDYKLDKHDFSDESKVSIGFTIDGENIFLKIDMMKIEMPEEFLELGMSLPKNTSISFYPNAFYK